MDVPFVYSDELASYKFSEDHPLRQERLGMVFDSCKRWGLCEEAHPFMAATYDDLLLFHTKEYVNAVRDIERGTFSGIPSRYGLGIPDNPLFENLYSVSSLFVGATLEGASLVESGGRAFVVSGGLHHAHAQRAAGFCVFNDVACAIMKLLREGRKVLYVDIDAHHADGVQEAFYDNDSVLTISFHENGHYLFPGTGFVEEKGAGKGEGYCVNVPLMPGTTDDSYLYAFREIVPPLAEAFSPDVVVSQLGIDTHFADPLADLSLTLGGYCDVVREIADLKGAWLAVGGGGYNVDVVVRGWTCAYAIVSEKELPWEMLLDKRVKENEGVHEYTASLVERVKREIFPFHGL